VDNLISADVVTADGNLLHTNDTENPDLFWALRGGGGNFGVVTSFEYQLHRVGPEVMVAQVFHPIEKSADVLRYYREFAAQAPDELACYALIVNVPPVDPFPGEHQGKPAIALVASYSGPLDEGEAQLTALRDFGNPILAAVQAMPFTVLQQSFDAGAPEGARYYWKAAYIDELTDDAIETFTALTENLPGPFCIVGFEPMGGAINRVEVTATAFPQRSANFALGIWSGWQDPADDKQAIAWTRDLYTAMTPHVAGGVYANYLDQDDDSQVHAAFGENLQRLREVKRRYDPHNLFRLNLNIDPSD
jgi:FAD/FMN-containing dehydrogenase